MRELSDAAADAPQPQHEPDRLPDPLTVLHAAAEPETPEGSANVGDVDVLADLRQTVRDDLLQQRQLGLEKGGGESKFTMEMEKYSDELNITLDRLDIVFENLIDIGCCVQVTRTKYPDGKRTMSLRLTPFGRELMRACKR